jgi:hypothetical protein
VFRMGFSTRLVEQRAVHRPTNTGIRALTRLSTAAGAMNATPSYTPSRGCLCRLCKPGSTSLGGMIDLPYFETLVQRSVSNPFSFTLMIGEWRESARLVNAFNEDHGAKAEQNLHAKTRSRAEHEAHSIFIRGRRRNFESFCCRIDLGKLLWTFRA